MATEGRDAHIARVRDVFDAWADEGRAEGMEEGHRFPAREAFGRLALRPGEHYLDVGCGNGYSVRWAAARVTSRGAAVGLDVSPRMVARARAASRDHPNATYHQAVFPSHPLANHTFDAVLSVEALYYLPSVSEGLRAVRALLRPEGRFACVVDYYLENPASHGWPELLNCPMNLLSMRGWRAAFEEAAFAVDEQVCLLHPLADGETPSWKHDQGSLLTFGVAR